MSERITLRIMQNCATGLLAAVSDDLRGLTVAARTLEELLEKLQFSVELMMKHERNQDVRVLGVDVGAQGQDVWAEYEPRTAVATYELLAVC